MSDAGLPPRPSTDPRVFYSSPKTLSAPPAYAPNDTVPRFLRALSVVIFVLGGCSSGITWAFHTWMYPPLLKMVQARRQLTQAADAAMGRLNDEIGSLSKSQGAQLILKTNRKPKKAPGPEALGPEAPGDNGGDKGGDTQEAHSEAKPSDTGKVADGERGENEEAGDPASAHEGLLMDGVCAKMGELRGDLVQLAELRRKTQPPDPLQDDVAEDRSVKLSEVSAEERLAISLKRLSSAVHMQNALSTSLSSQFPASKFGFDYSMTRDAAENKRKTAHVAHEMRTEARHFKGALLNRRTLKSFS